MAVPPNCVKPNACYSLYTCISPSENRRYLSWQVIMNIKLKSIYVFIYSSCYNKYHRLHDLNNSNLFFLTVLEAGSLGSRCQQGCFLARALFWVCRRPFSQHILTWLSLCTHRDRAPLVSPPSKDPVSLD